MNIGFNFKSPAALASARVSLSLSSFYQKLRNYHFWFNISKLLERHVYKHTHTHTSCLVFSLLTYVYLPSCICLYVTPETEAYQVPLSMEFSKNTRVGCYSLLQGIFSTQGSNLCLLHLLHWQNALPLCYLGSPLLKYAFIYSYIAFSVCQNHDTLVSLSLDKEHLLRDS